MEASDAQDSAAVKEEQAHGSTDKEQAVLIEGGEEGKEGEREGEEVREQQQATTGKGEDEDDASKPQEAALADHGNHGDDAQGITAQQQRKEPPSTADDGEQERDQEGSTSPRDDNDVASDSSDDQKTPAEAAETAQSHAKEAPSEQAHSAHSALQQEQQQEKHGGEDQLNQSNSALGGKMVIEKGGTLHYVDASDLKAQSIDPELMFDEASQNQRTAPDHAAEKEKDHKREDEAVSKQLDQLQRSKSARPADRVSSARAHSARPKSHMVSGTDARQQERDRRKKEAAEAQQAFLAWKARKDAEIRERNKKTRERTLSREERLQQKRERDKLAEQNFEAWLKKKNEAKKRDKAGSASSLDATSRASSRPVSMHSHNHRSEEETEAAFDSWLQRKKDQQRQEMQKTRFRGMLLSQQLEHISKKKEESQEAFDNWLRRKRKEKLAEQAQYERRRRKQNRHMRKVYESLAQTATVGRQAEAARFSLSTSFGGKAAPVLHNTGRPRTYHH